MLGYNFIGRTLIDIHRACGVNFDGYSVFVLQDENDDTGIRLGESISIGLILKDNPQYANCKVKYENDFYGTKVLRVEKEDEGK